MKRQPKTAKILPQEAQKTCTVSTSGASTVQCWAHTKQGIRCQIMVHSREGEPVPIPYCDRHLKYGDGALKVVNHPFAGKALVARYVYLQFLHTLFIFHYHLFPYVWILYKLDIDLIYQPSIEWPIGDIVVDVLHAPKKIERYHTTHQINYLDEIKI